MRGPAASQRLRLACAAAVLLGAAGAPARLDGALAPTIDPSPADLERRASWGRARDAVYITDIEIGAHRAI